MCASEPKERTKEQRGMMGWTIVKGERKSRKTDERKRGGSEVAEELVSFAPVHLWGSLVRAFLVSAVLGLLQRYVQS